MTRTIISLEDADKAWLDEKARQSGTTMTALVRTAIRQMRDAERVSFDDLLRKTSGTWNKGDGLKYQGKLRSEWK